MAHEVRTRYNRPATRVSLVAQDGMTHQEFRDDCDINRIMKKYLKTGLVPMFVEPGRYGDFSTVGDFHEAQETLIRAKTQFDSLPAKVRERFKNDPGEFLAWVKDAKVSDFDDEVYDLLTPEARERIKKEKVAVVPPPTPEVKK